VDSSVTLKEAAREVGLRLPVRVRYDPELPYLGEYNGPHRRFLRKRYHLITLGPLAATHTIWHELGHALQCERHGNDYLATRKALWETMPHADALRRLGRLFYTDPVAWAEYWNSPWEVEARSFERDIEVRW
jgi:hypothetical protein